MTPELTLLVARLEIRVWDTIYVQAAAALRELQAEVEYYRDESDAHCTERGKLSAELAAEKAAHWRTCQTAAHEAEQLDITRAVLAALKDPPL